MPEDLGARIREILSPDLVKEPIDPNLFQKMHLRRRVQRGLEESRKVVREASAETLRRFIR